MNLIKFLSENAYGINPIFFNANQDKPLYHYTSPDGLLGILKSDKIALWFSKYDCLNDSSEGKHIIAIHKETVNLLLKSGEIDKSFYDTIIDCKPSIQRHFARPPQNEGGGIDHFSKSFDTYLCCFSNNPDSIDMWRHYIKNNTCNGFCIDFSPQLFNNIGKIQISSNYQESRIQLGEVVYDDDKKIEILKAEILQLKVERKTREWEIPIIMSTILLECQFFLKHKCFESEKEIRAIYTVSTGDVDIGEKKPTLKYRTNAGVIIPYFEVEIPKEHLQSIKLSPLMSDSAENSLDSYLKNNGYTNYTIDKSTLPIRY